MIKVFNTLGKKKQVFKPIKDKEVRMYVCGPTVYDYIHIGNAKTFLNFDIIIRYLKYRGYKVKYVQNITDVGHLTEVGDDKIMAGAAKRKMDPFDFVKLMTQEYFKDLEDLNILKPNIFSKATEHIPDMIKDIKKIIKNSYGYVSDGYVYFDISKFKDYGKLSGQDPEELKKQRTEPHPKKKNPGDFALWIPAPKDYPMKWKSPWSEGFPGWHLECSTMSSKYLGLPFDIHGGGKDLIFPHHENEIAQAEAATGKKFVKYWLHSEFLKINNQKMSKSLGNFYTAQEFIQKHGAQLTRFLLISKHYQTELNITNDSIKAAKEGLTRLKNTVTNLKFRIQNSKPGKPDSSFLKEIKKHKQEFIKQMDNNFNTPGAFAAIFDLAKDLNIYQGNKQTLQAGLNLLLELTNVLGLILEEKLKIPKKVQDLVQKREGARTEKHFPEADKLRQQIKNLGYWVDDTKKGPIVKKL